MLICVVTVSLNILAVACMVSDDLHLDLMIKGIEDSIEEHPAMNLVDLGPRTCKPTRKDDYIY